MHGLEFTMCVALPSFFDTFTLAFMSVRILEQFFIGRHGMQVLAGYTGGHGFSRILRFEDAWRMTGLIGGQDEV